MSARARCAVFPSLAILGGLTLATLALVGLPRRRGDLSLELEPAKRIFKHADVGRASGGCRPAAAPQVPAPGAAAAPAAAGNAPRRCRPPQLPLPLLRGGLPPKAWPTFYMATCSCAQAQNTTESLHAALRAAYNLTADDVAHVFGTSPKLLPRGLERGILSVGGPSRLRRVARTSCCRGRPSPCRS